MLDYKLLPSTLKNHMLLRNYYPTSGRFINAGHKILAYMAEENGTFKTIHFKIQMTVLNFSISDEGLFLTKSD